MKSNKIEYMEKERRKKMGIKIKNVEIAFPKKTVDNDYYIKWFEKQGKDIRGLLRAFGRKERKIGDEATSTISLGSQAAMNVIRNSNTDPKEIDMILFSSQFPEYTCPNQALIVHNLIGGKSDDEIMVMDINSNCVGMIMALDIVNGYMLEKKKFKKALIIGADYMTIHCNEFDEMTYPIYGDVGCAMIVENVDDNEGLIDSISFANSEEYDTLKYPNCGLSSIYDEQIDDKKKKLSANQPNPEKSIQSLKNSVDRLLEDNNLSLDQIAMFCISQCAISFINRCAEVINVPKEKIIYVGDKYGYTGTSSPFIALYEAMKNNLIKRGEYIIFWSVGTNWVTDAVLIKF